MIDVYKTDEREGFCMECSPDHHGNFPKRTLYGFRLGIFCARLCRIHAGELRRALTNAGCM